MSNEIRYDRRHFLGAAVMSIAATKLINIGSASAQSRQVNSTNATPIKAGTNQSFAPLKQIVGERVAVQVATRDAPTLFHQK